MHEHLTEFYNSHIHSMRCYENFPETIEIRQLTSFLDNSGLYSKICYPQRMWHIINNKLELKRCKICSKPLFWNKKKGHYPETCNCKECKSQYAASNIVVQKRVQTNLRKYGVKHLQQTEEWKDNLKKHNLRTYGVVGYTQTDEFKEKSKKTCLEKYGAEYSGKSEIVQQKAKQTCLEKYGAEYYQQTEEFKHRYKTELSHKVKETNRRKYGVDWYYQSEEFKEKANRTRLERFGATSHSQSDHWKSLMYENFKNTLINLGYYDLGYKLISYKGNGDYEVYCPHCKQNFITKTSGQFWNRHPKHHEICTNCNPLIKFYSYGEKEVLSYVSSIYDGAILENDRSVIRPYELDIYLPDLRSAIEYNGDYWHANPKYYSEDHIIGEATAKEVRKKDKQKINRCIKAGIELLIIWEDDWTNRQDVVKQELLDIITELTEKRTND